MRPKLIQIIAFQDYVLGLDSRGWLWRCVNPGELSGVWSWHLVNGGVE